MPIRPSSSWPTAGPYDDDDRSAWHQSWSSSGLDRLTHLVLVDGRLVDTWSEPVEGTRWQEYADRFDGERRPVAHEPPPPPRPPYDEMLDWLDSLLGGRAAVEAFTAEPVRTVAPPLPLDDLDLRSRHRIESVADLLDLAGEECFGPETALALRCALVIALEAEPELVLHGKSAAHTAAGLCWAFGKANGLFGSGGVTTQSRVQEVLGLPSSLSGPGPSMQRALQGFQPRPGCRPGTGPDLLPLGHAELLTSSTRRLLVRLRDRALAAKRAHETVLP